MGLTQNVLGENICLYKYAHNSGPRWAPDMTLTAFDVKFHEKKMSHLPKPETHKQNQKKTNATRRKTPVCSLNVTVNGTPNGAF